MIVIVSTILAVLAVTGTALVVPLLIGTTFLVVVAALIGIATCHFNVSFFVQKAKVMTILQISQCLAWYLNLLPWKEEEAFQHWRQKEGELKNESATISY